jgi:hypothetical protein
MEFGGLTPALECCILGRQYDFRHQKDSQKLHHFQPRTY